VFRLRFDTDSLRTLRQKAEMIKSLFRNVLNFNIWQFEVQLDLMNDFFLPVFVVVPLDKEGRNGIPVFHRAYFPQSLKARH
jgi:hypothetical protein